MKLLVLGATGNLGQAVAQAALAQGMDLTVLVRSPSKVPPEVAARARIVAADLQAIGQEDLARHLSGQDAVINCSGNVADGAGFTALIERIVGAAESLIAGERPVIWLLAGAAMLELDRAGRRGVDLPKVKDRYWPHAVNHARLQASDLDWRLLCPGPMVEEPVLGLEAMRVSIDVLPAPLPGMARALPKLALLVLFAQKVPEMIVSYSDAASVMLANLAPGGAMSRRRVGIALPRGRRGRKG